MDKEFFARIESKVDRLDTRLDGIDVTLAGQHVQLTEHIRRTGILEDDMKPVKLHVARVGGALSFVGLLATGVGLMAGIVEIIKLIKESHG